jgi:hypothetical protein
MALILAVLVRNSHALYTVQCIHVCILFCLARLAAEIRGNEVKSLHDTGGSLYSHNLHTSLFKGPPPRDREIEFQSPILFDCISLLASLLQLYCEKQFVSLKNKF